MLALSERGPSLTPTRPAIAQDDSGLSDNTGMSVEWLRDPDAALAKAAAESKPLLIDFSAAPT
jgi:hypothetical protein